MASRIAALLVVVTGVACGGTASSADAQLPALCVDASGTYDLSLDWGDSPGACGLQGIDPAQWTLSSTGASNYAVASSDSTVAGTGFTEINTRGDCVLRLSLTYERAPDSYELSGTFTELGGLVGGVGTITEGAAGCTQAWNASTKRLRRPCVDQR